MQDESVHYSHFKERLAFEVSVNSSEVLALVQKILEKNRELTQLANQLIAAVQVAESSQDHR